MHSVSFLHLFEHLNLITVFHNIGAWNVHIWGQQCYTWTSLFTYCRFILKFWTSSLLNLNVKKKRSEHISPKSLVCLYLHLTISLSFHHPPPFILIFLLATNLFAIFIFHAVCYSVTSAQLRLWTAAQTQILLCLTTPPQKKIRPPFYLSFSLSGIGTHSKPSATKLFIWNR